VVPHRPQSLKHDEDADAVVHRLAHKVAADLLQRAVHHRVVADAHLLLDLFGGQAEVDEEFVRLRGLVVLLGRDVRGLALRLERAP